MRTIALVTRKGGAGKSTLAASIAAAAKDAREAVVCIDLDPQQSLTNWGALRGDGDIQVVTCTPGRLEALLASYEAQGFTLAVIDTAAGESPGAEAAIRASDLCLVPSRPSLFDLLATEATRKSIRSLRRDYAFLLNQCPPMLESARVQAGVEALEAMGGLISPLIASRVDYQEAVKSGLGVTEYNPHGKASEEMQSLWRAVKRRIGKPAVRKAA